MQVYLGQNHTEESCAKAFLFETSYQFQKSKVFGKLGLIAYYGE
jgi:hypothetical protein